MSFLFSSSASSKERDPLPSTLKEIPDHLKGSAVIRLSNEGTESCRPAVMSIIHCAHYFKDIHIVCRAANVDTEYYQGFNKHLETLRGLKVNVIRHSQFNEQALETLLLIEVPADCDVTKGAFDALFDTMSTSPNVNEAAVSSQLSLEPNVNTAVTILEAMFSYGFLLVLLFFDTLRSLITLGQYSRTVDLRARRLSCVYPALKKTPPNRWYMWWFFTGVARTQRGDATCIQTPSDAGVAFVVRTIKQHRSLPWLGTWWIGFWAYYALFAWPWWNWFLSPTSALGLYLVRDMTALYWAIPYLLHCFTVGVVAWVYVEEYPYRLLAAHVLFYPFFLAFAPLAIALGKVFQLKSSARRKMLRQKLNKPLATE